MGIYNISSVEGELREYVFDFGGVIALRNFTARTSGERIIIESTENNNFAILDALVSEIVIDGVVYDDPVEAQEALNRLVFSEYPLTILTQEERTRLIWKISEQDPDATKLIRADGTLVEPTTEAAVLDDVDVTDTGGYMQFKNTEGDLMAQISVEAIKQAMDLSNITGDFE